MFDTVGRTTHRNRKRQAGAFALSMLVNVAILGGLAWATSKVVEEVVEDDQEVLVPVNLSAPPPPPPPPPAGGKKKTPKKPDEVKIIPENVPIDPTPLPEEVPETEAEADAGVEGGVEGGVENGVVGGVVGGVKDGVLGGQLGAPPIKTVHWSEVQIKSRVEPDFPEAARSLNIKEENCIVTIFIDEKGVPSKVEPDRCSDLFAANSIEAAMKWRFYPVKEDGKGVATRFKLTIKYRLK